MKIILFTLLYISSFSLLAQSENDFKKRLDFVNGELLKIQERIDGGQNPKLFQKFIKDFKAEKADLETKISNVPISNTVTKKTKKKAAKRTPPNRIRVKKNITPNVDIYSFGGSSLSQINVLLKKEREKYISLMGRGISGDRVNQILVNISYLELEKSKLTNANPEAIAGGKSQKINSILKYKGHFQFRTESARNQKGSQGTRQSEQSFFRLRTNFTFSPNKKLDFNLSPQATKGFGADDASGNATSGSTTHTEVFFYEANINYRLMDSLSVKLGRQEIAYGDHLIIGSLPWANTARSFDGLKLKLKYWKGWSDVFYSKISDNATSSSPKDDADLITFYNSYSINQYLKPIDLYYIHQDDDRTGKSEVNTFGFRIKGGHGPFFYRTENGFQSGANLGDDAYQYNLELGGKYKGYSASFEYALAGPDYTQLYPTAHKFLGFADVLGRRNIEQYAIHLKGSPLSWLTIKADYHILKRHKTDKSAYKLNGTTEWGTAGSSDDIGDELDLVFIFKTSDNLKMQLGAAWFNPGTYMKNNDSSSRDESVRFIYGQVNAHF